MGYSTYLSKRSCGHDGLLYLHVLTYVSKRFEYLNNGQISNIKVLGISWPLVDYPVYEGVFLLSHEVVAGWTASGASDQDRQLPKKNPRSFFIAANCYRWLSNGWHCGQRRQILTRM